MKKIGFMTLLITASLLFTLAFPAAAAGPKAPAAPAVAAAPAAAVAAMPEGHPHIHEALEAMRAARHQLEQAERGFEGHREEAIKHLDRAIHEAEICEGIR
ncbi:MAG TPA: hypothetical protein VIH89_18960 [Candidatus Sulfotelmatobacter sp.]|jgi:hypothetical protein